MAVQTQIQTRRGTAASWTSTNPTLAAGEIGFESDTGKFKIGNGSTAWASLAYATNGAAVSPLTTKGDLYTYSTADARLPVGANGETIVADSSTSTGLRYTAGTVQANPIINSAMQIWQRGTSIALTTSAYTADRWQGFRNTTGSTASRQVTNDTTNLPNIQYCARVQRDSGNSSTTAVYFGQSLESVNSIPFAGKTITVSFYARAGATLISSGAAAISLNVQSGTGTDQNILTAGYTGSTNVISQPSITLTATWQRFTYTSAAVVPVTATELGLYFTLGFVGTAGASDFMEVTGVQIDVGSVALPFRTYAGTIQGELAACQRYFYLNTSGGTNSAFAGGFAFDASTLLAPNTMPVTMRIAPTLSATTGTNFYKVQGGGYVNNFNTLILWGATTTNVVFQNGSGTSLATQGQGLMLLTNNASSFVALSAEL
jgi:hypothetical protein